MIEHIQINAVAPRVQYDADGLQMAFTFPFAVFKADDLEVWLDGVQAVGGFSVSGVGVSAGGSVLFTVPPASGVRVTLRRRLAPARISDFQADGIIRAKTLNDELDYQVAALQQVADDVSRCLQRPFTSPSTAELSLPEPAAGRALKWNSAATGLENSSADVDEAAAIATAQANAAAAARAAADTDRTAVAADRAAVHAERLTVAADAAATAADRGAVAADRTAVTALHDQALGAAVNAEAAARSVGTRLVGTSVTALTIAAGTQSLVAEAGKGWVAGMTVTIFVSAEPGRFMTGRVTRYDPATGQLDLEVEDVQGSGAANAWTVVLSGRRGMAGQGSGDMLASNLLSEIASQGAPARQTARGNLGLGAVAVRDTVDAGSVTLTAPAIVGRTGLGAGSAAELSLSQVLDLVGNAAQGDVLYRGASQWTRLAAGNAGQVLQSGGANGNPAWATVQSMPYAGGYRGCAVFTSSGTFTVPGGVTEVCVDVFGGGGSAVYGNRTACGAGGGRAIKRVAVSPGQQIAVTVGGASGTSSFGGWVSATGGQSAYVRSDGYAMAATAGGYGVGGDINCQGTPGSLTVGGGVAGGGWNGGVPGGGSSAVNDEWAGARGEVRVFW